MTNSIFFSQSADVIELGHKYGADIAVDRGMMKFWRAFICETRSTLPITSRYGKGVIIKFISLWHQVINQDLFSSPELIKMYDKGFKSLWTRWCIRCSTNKDKATILDFIDYESGKFFSGEEICVAAVFIDSVRNNASDLCLHSVLERLKKEKLERQKKR